MRMLEDGSTLSVTISGPSDKSPRFLRGSGKRRERTDSKIGGEDDEETSLIHKNFPPLPSGGRPFEKKDRR